MYFKMYSNDNNDDDYVIDDYIDDDDDDDNDAYGDDEVPWQRRCLSEKLHSCSK